MNYTIEPVLRLTRQLLDPLALEEALQIVVDTVLELLPGDHVSIRVLDQAGERLLCGARAGRGTEYKPLTFRRGEGVLGWVVEHGKSARVADGTLDSRFMSAPEQGFEIRGLIAAPLWSSGRVVGVLNVSSSVVGAFSEEDEMMTLLLANCAAPTIEKARLEHLTITDYLTMAYNRRYLFPRLTEEIERARRQNTPLHILSIDMDHFKLTNDQYGHAAGDRVLQSFADRVRSSVRLSDILIRRGGDEFVLIMPNLPDSQTAETASRLQRCFSALPLNVGSDRPIKQTISIGAAGWDGNESAETLESRADLAMYEAKRRGRNQVVIAKRLSHCLDYPNARCPRDNCCGKLTKTRTNGGMPYLCCSEPGCNIIAQID